ncbi:MAG: DNA-processing protein DprA [bacterium]|nr:DNA-processing protein DprA [bacterium]
MSGGIEEQAYWLAFTLVPGIGGRRIEHLLSAFGSLNTAWNAPESALRTAALDEGTLQNLLNARKTFDPAAEWNKVTRTGASVLIRTAPDYPLMLQHIADPPPLLYMRGQFTTADTKALAIVGTRKATRYGLDAAYRLAHELAAQGVTIVSGLAQGIDAAAHQGALDAGGRTIAVLGNGIDAVYPREHHALAARIAGQGTVQAGAIISEFPIGSRPEARHFPRRNRVISGLSLGVLIVEAPEKSGALITATTALDQGRDVFAVPGSIFSAASAGTHRLIQDGAKLVTNARDILDELAIAYEQQEVRAAVAAYNPQSEAEHALLQLLSIDPVHIDDLIRQSGLPAALVSSTLTILEAYGAVSRAAASQHWLRLQS